MCYKVSMSDDTISENPAVKVRTALPPALLDAIAADPEASRDYFRRLTTIQLHELYLVRKTLTPAQRMQLSEITAKLGAMEPKRQEASAAQGAQFSIQINIPQVGASPASSRVIEVAHEAVQLPAVIGGVPDERQVHQSGGRAGGVDQDDDLDYQDTD